MTIEERKEAEATCAKLAASYAADGEYDEAAKWCGAAAFHRKLREELERRQ